MPFFLNELVETPYGKGKVIGFNDTHVLGATKLVIVEPSNWKLANDKPPTFYLNQADVKSVISVGSNIICSFGAGTVQSIRDVDGIYVVSLPNWTLANSKPALAYLNAHSVTLAPAESNKTPPITKTKGFDEVYERAISIKEEGKRLYVQKQFEEAKIKYGQAINSLHSLDGDFTNEERAKLYEMSLTCNSNLALCAWNLQNEKETIIFGKNTLLLLQAMEQKVGIESEVWNELQKRGYDVQKLLDMRLKSLRVLVKAEIKKGDYEEAKKDAESALALEYDAKRQEEFKTLIADCSRRIAIQNKKEAKAWKKAFSGKVPIVDEEEERRLAQSNSQQSSPEKGNGNGRKADRQHNHSKNGNGDDYKQFQDDNNSLFSVNSNYFLPLLSLGLIGVVGTVAYWMTRRR